MGDLLFPDIPMQLNEAYQFLKEVLADIRNIPQGLTEIQFQKIAKEIRRSLNTIKLVCVKINAEAQIARDFNKKLNISHEERGEIVNKICDLAEELNSFSEEHSIQEFLINYPDLAGKLYLKMYGEGEDYLPEDIYESEEEFLGWISRVIYYIDNVIQELDKTFTGM